jgi:hypothetical protein
VLQPFSYDEAHPYLAGQHRGIDIGADAAGAAVVAPATGTVSFAGTVPTNGRSVTIETADGYAVTLTHLGSIAVVEGTTVGEGDPVGAVGPSGAPEVDGPYVHLGIRVAADPNGYVDPLGLLPPAPESGATDSGSTPSVPSSGGASSTVSTSEPGPPAVGPSVGTTRGSRVLHGRADGSGRRPRRAQESRADVRVRRPSHRAAIGDVHAPRVTAMPSVRLSRSASSSRRPVVETTAAAPGEPTGLGAGHEIRSSARGAPSVGPSSGPLPLVCNAVAALVALGAALAAGRRSGRRSGASPPAVAEVLELPRPRTEYRRAA